jgi:hypothetical protein
MKKIIAGLAVATIFSGVVSIPTMAWAEDDRPECAVVKVVPPQIPLSPGQRCGQ